MQQLQNLIGLIVKILLMFYNRLEEKRLKKQIEQNKEGLDEKLEKVRNDYDNLLDEYDDYLRVRDREMRQGVEKVHGDGKDTK